MSPAAAQDQLREWLGRLVSRGEAPLGTIDDEFAALLTRTRLTWLAVASGASHPSLAGVAREAFVRATILERAAAVHVKRLAAAGVPAVTLKGPAFAVQILGDATARSSGDIDLLVRRRDLPRVRTVLVADGMADAPHYPVWYEERWHDHAAFTGARGSEPVTVEVRWDIVRPGLSRLDVGEILAGAETVDCDGARLPAPSIAWQFVLAAAHAAQHSFDGRGVLDVALAGRVLDSVGQSRAVAAARRSGLGRPSTTPRCWSPLGSAGLRRPASRRSAPAACATASSGPGSGTGVPTRGSHGGGSR